MDSSNTFLAQAEELAKNIHSMLENVRREVITLNSAGTLFIS